MDIFAKRLIAETPLNITKYNQALLHNLVKSVVILTFRYNHYFG